MPQIIFKKNLSRVNCAFGENLMEVLIKNNIPVASSCGGDGVCAKCKILIIDGIYNLDPPNPLEDKLALKGNKSTNERFSCQVQVKGDLLIDTPYW